MQRKHCFQSSRSGFLGQKFSQLWQVWCEISTIAIESVSSAFVAAQPRFQHSQAPHTNCFWGCCSTQERNWVFWWDLPPLSWILLRVAPVEESLRSGSLALTWWWLLCHLKRQQVEANFVWTQFWGASACRVAERLMRCGYDIKCLVALDGRTRRLCLPDPYSKVSEKHEFLPTGLQDLHISPSFRLPICMMDRMAPRVPRLG